MKHLEKKDGMSESVLLCGEADPDSTDHPEADPVPDPDPSFQIKAQTLEKVLKIDSYTIYFGYLTQKLMDPEHWILKEDADPIGSGSKTM